MVCTLNAAVLHVYCLCLLIYTCILCSVLWVDKFWLIFPIYPWKDKLWLLLPTWLYCENIEGGLYSILILHFWTIKKRSHLTEISTNKLEVFVMWSHWNILTYLSHIPPQILKLPLLHLLPVLPLLLLLLKLLHPPPLAPVLHYHQLHNQPLYLPTTQKVAMHRSPGMGCSQSVVTVVTSNLVNTN